MAFTDIRTCRPQSAKRRRQGFSLIELVIALAILAVLTALALPSYQSYVRRGNRAAAQTEMLSIASLQQQYFLSNRVYTATLSDLGYALPTEVARNYTAAVSVSTGLSGSPLSCQATGSGVPSFCITLTPTGSQVPDGTLAIDSFGLKARSGDSSKWSSSSS